MPRVLPRHVEKQWGIGGVYPQFEKNLKKVRLTSPNSSLSKNVNHFVVISGFDEISGLWTPQGARRDVTIYLSGYSRSRLRQKVTPPPNMNR
ncbi:MAG: hypothetical protein ACO4CS_19050, partial [bacterium]